MKYRISLPWNGLFATRVYLWGNLPVRLASQCKSLRKFNLRSLATTCRSVWPGLNEIITVTCYPKYLPFIDQLYHLQGYLPPIAGEALAQGRKKSLWRKSLTTNLKGNKIETRKHCCERKWAARETYVAETNFAARKLQNVFASGQKHFCRVPRHIFFASETYVSQFSHHESNVV